MLQITDFPFPVSQHTDEKRTYWQYEGNLYCEFLTFVTIVHNAGEAFNLPGDGISQVHREFMTAKKADLLIAMVQLHDFCGLVWLRYPEDFPNLRKQDARLFDTNYNYLRHFGLAESAPSNHHKYRCVKWRATDAGHAFAAGTGTCPEYVINKGTIVLRVSSKQIQLNNLFGSECIDDVQKYPLHWKSESERAEILKEHYHPVPWRNQQPKNVHNRELGI